ncbi:MAG TPA: cupin domain-containing protein [Candidatus Acidoferrales bacterium]|jgi:hypothetical protein|nr:cupin domain-containing protein [Candidatus Acidoferrales bacterium]
MKRTLKIGFLVALACSVATLATPQAKHETSTPGKKEAAMKLADHGLFTPSDIKWVEAPNALPSGAKLAVLEGDPFKAGLYTMRLSMPAGYQIPPHWHVRTEHVTVVSGTFNLGMGEKFDKNAGHAMPAGTFGFLAPQMRHFAWANEETVIQLHGMGPWEIVYVNPSDDPRRAKK